MKINQDDITRELQLLKIKFTTLESLLYKHHYSDNKDNEIIYSTQNSENNIKLNIFYKDLHNKDIKQKIKNLSTYTKENNRLFFEKNREKIYNLLIDIRNNISVINCKLLDKSCSFFNFYGRYKRYIKNKKLNRKKIIELEKEIYLTKLLNGIEEVLYYYN